jgi:VWFA-related protein
MARRTCSFVAFLLPVLALVAANPADITAQGSTFKSGVEMVPLTVTVTDGAGNYVNGLSERDFAVFEDGVPQPLSFFASESVPVDVAFVIDTSGSMSTDLPLVQQAAKGLVSALRDGDRGAVVSVSSVVGMPQRFTTDHAGVAAAIDALRSSGSTALYDGVYIVLKEFAREQRYNTDVRRQVLVLLSDGVDTVSHVSADEVTELAKRVGVNIYVIAIKGPTIGPSTVWRDPEQRAAFTMRARSPGSWPANTTSDTCLRSPAATASSGGWPSAFCRPRAPPHARGAGTTRLGLPARGGTAQTDSARNRLSNRRHDGHARPGADAPGLAPGRRES